jgi:hypothetical protein
LQSDPWSYGPTVVVFNNGTQDFWQLNAANTQRTFAGAAVHGSLGARVRNESGVVQVELWTTKQGLHSLHRGPGEGYSIDSNQPKIPLGTYVVPQSGRVTVDRGVAYGLPVLNIRLGTVSESCLYDPTAIQLLPSLQLVGTGPLGPMGECTLQLRNGSSHRITEVHVVQTGPKSIHGSIIESGLDVPPGGIVTLLVGVPARPGQQGDIGGIQIRVSYVAFTDASYEGHLESPRIQHAGEIAVHARLAAFLKNALAKWPEKASEPNLLAAIQAEGESLPLTDEFLEQNVLTRLQIMDPEIEREAVREGMQNARNDFLAEIQSYIHRPDRASNSILGASSSAVRNRCGCSPAR